MNASTCRWGIPVLFALLFVGVNAVSGPASKTQAETPPRSNPVRVHYLEIVTPSVSETCDALAGVHGLVFGEPIAEFGYARTASMANGDLLGVRAPLRDTEEPVVRPYLLVDDIDAAVKAAEGAGAEVAIPPMEMPGGGKYSIYILGGIDHGLWER